MLDYLLDYFKKKIILKDDLFTRVKKIDETRSLKLKDLFQKKVEI